MGKSCSSALSRIVFLMLLAATSCRTEEGPEALFHEAKVAWDATQAAEADDPQSIVRRWEALALANDRLRLIQSSYPDSSLAVDLRNGRASGGPSIQDVSDGLHEASSEIGECQSCQSLLLAAEARSIRNDYDRFLALLTVAEYFRDVNLVTEAYSIALGIHGVLDASDDHDRALRQFALGAAKAGFPDLSYSALDSLDNQAFRGAVLCDIAAAQAEIGQIDEALSTLDLARSQHMLFPNKDSFPSDVPELAAKAAIAVAMARSSRYDDAVQILQTIHDSFLRNRATLEISILIIEDGNWKAASDLIAPVPDSFETHDHSVSKAEVVERIVASQIEAGQVANAFETIASIPDASARVQALGAAAVAQAGSGAFDEAMTTANMIEDWYRPVVLSRLAMVQAEAGHIDSALQLISTVQDTGIDPRNSVAVPAWDERPKAYRLISAAQARSGDWAAALATARSIRDEWPLSERIGALIQLAKMRSDPEIFAEAFAYASAARERIAMDMVLQGEAETGFWLDALAKLRFDYARVFPHRDNRTSSSDTYQALRAIIEGMSHQ